MVPTGHHVQSGDVGQPNSFFVTRAVYCGILKGNRRRGTPNIAVYAARTGKRVMRADIDGPYDRALTYCELCGAYMDPDDADARCDNCEEREYREERHEAIPVCPTHEIETLLADAPVDDCTVECWRQHEH